jgi:hypothetical protein
MLVTFAGWIAPAATMIAAMMTAANLGARVTGWGFVIFTVGAVAWIVTALASGQQNLLIANSFLLVVDAIGIWRWLGQRAVYAEGAQAATDDSVESASPNLFALASLEGRPLLAPDGAEIGVVVDAMATCAQGRIVYVVVREGGISGVGERLHALDWGALSLDEAGVRTRLDARALAARPALQADHWPTLAELGR